MSRARQHLASSMKAFAATVAARRTSHRDATCPGTSAARLSRILVMVLIATSLAPGMASAQSARSAPANAAASSAATASAPAAANPPAPQGAADLQGLWDFNMRVGDRTSPGFIGLGPVERGWAGSITMYLTNTLAIRPFTVEGDSVRMVVVSREGDVVFRARLSDDGRTLDGIVEYHGGARLPMVALRRAQPAVPR